MSSHAAPILVAPTAFKGTLSAREVADAMAAGVRQAAPGRAVRTLPLSDGGNGLLDALDAAVGGVVHRVQVTGPLGDAVSARYLVQGSRVVVETAEACGLHLVPPGRRDPLGATSRGVGELLLAATGTPRPAGLVVGLGGSASVDAGAGMVTALGWGLLDAVGERIPPGGAGLHRLVDIRPPEDVAGRRPLPRRVVLADVTSPLLGADGAAAVFAPQKGAGPADVALLEDGLARWSEVVSRELGVDVSDLPGAGAAGGLGAAFAAFLGTPPEPGADWLLAELGFDALVSSAAVVVTGEGAWDRQSTMGKIAGAVVSRARGAGVPVLLVAGSVDGPVPAGVTAVTGAGGTLDGRSLSGLVRDGLPALLAAPGRP